MERGELKLGRCGQNAPRQKRKHGQGRRGGQDDPVAIRRTLHSGVSAHAVPAPAANAASAP